MARRRPRAPLRPRVVNDAQLAEYLNKSLSWLGEHRRELEAEGFPPKMPGPIGGNDLEAVDLWLDGARLRAQPDRPSAPDIERLIAKAMANVR